MNIDKAPGTKGKDEPKINRESIKQVKDALEPVFRRMTNE